MIHWYRGEMGGDEVCLRLDSPAFRFGAGVFETICYNGSTLCHFGRHLERMDASLAALGFGGLDMDEGALAGVVMEVVRASNLAGRMARVNIYCLAEGGRVHPLVTARAEGSDPGRLFRLGVSPERHLTPLARHKTMNYLFYDRARRLAGQAGFDGAVLTDADNLIVEADSSALLFSKAGCFTAPASVYALPSTALAAASEVLSVSRRPVALDEAAGFEHAYVLNSMIGMRPVVCIGEMEFAPDEASCRMGTDAVWCRAG